MSSSSRLFSWRQTAIVTVLFVGVAVAAQRALRYISQNWVPFDCPYYWPISIFEVRNITLRDLAVAAIVGAAFYLFVRFLDAKRYSLWPSIALAAVLIAGTTLIQGVDVGYYAPIAGDARTGVLTPYSTDGQEYYHDALKIADPADFFARYNKIQPTLSSHGHTHPPGAVLTFYFLEKLLVDPALIAVLIMLVSTGLTMFYFYRLMATELSGEMARYMAFLIALLPAVQIYYLATIDALVTGILTGVLYLFCFGKGKSAIAGAAAMLTASFLLTYVSLFILPVLVGFELIIKRSLKRSLIVIGGVALIHLLFYMLTGYDAFHAFREASHYENPKGFMLLVDPVNYLFTRIEDVVEIIFFFGPFLTLLFIRGMRDLKLRPLDVLTALGCITLLGMYAVGAWRTGETARACAYIYPYLLFPVGRYLEENGIDAGGRTQLAALVFAQSLGMQIIGNYHW